MADVIVRCKQFACNTGTGTQDLTITGFGTPKAALFFLTLATTAGTPAANAGFMVGATDGTRQWSNFSSSENNVANTDCYRVQCDDSCITFLSGTTSTVVGKATFSAWITDGVTINWSTAPASAYLLTVVLFGGTDLTARADAFDLGNVATAQTYSSMGFTADLLITSCLGEAANETVANAHAAMLGAVHNGGSVTQRFLVQVESDNAAAAAPSHQIRNDGGGISAGLQVSFSNFGSAGFDFTCTSGAGGDFMGMLALKLGGASAWVGSLDSPTGTGDWAKTDPGFRPQFVMLGMGMAAAENTTESDDDADAFSVSVFDKTGADFCHGLDLDDASDPTDTDSIADTDAIDINADAAAKFDATFSAMTATGFTLNFSTADGTTRKWFGLAIGEGFPPKPPLIHSFALHRSNNY